MPLDNKISTEQDGFAAADPLQPVDADNNPIRWTSGNKAEIPGHLHELGLFLERKRLFKPLLEQGIVSMPNGKIAIEAISSIPFKMGLVKERSAYSFENPPSRHPPPAAHNP